MKYIPDLRSALKLSWLRHLSTFQKVTLLAIGVLFILYFRLATSINSVKEEVYYTRPIPYAPVSVSSGSRVDALEADVKAMEEEIDKLKERVSKIRDHLGIFLF